MDATHSLIEQVREIAPQVVQLAIQVSVASRIEPVLLRRARLELCHGMEAGVEIELWNCPFVESRSPMAMVLRSEVARRLQKELKRKYALQKAYRVTADCHRELPETIRLEEEITWRVLAGGKRQESKVRRLLKRVTNTLVHGDQPDLAYWVARFLSRAPDIIRDFPESWMLNLAASSRMGGVELLSADALPKDLRQDELIWAISQQEQAGRLFVGRNGNDLLLSVVPPKHGTERSIPVPLTDPIIVELDSDESLEPRLYSLDADATEPLSIPLTSGELRLRTTSGDVYQISSPTFEGDAASVETIEAGENDTEEAVRPWSTAVLLAFDYTSSKLKPFHHAREDANCVSNWLGGSEGIVPRDRIHYIDPTISAEEVYSAFEQALEAAEQDNYLLFLYARGYVTDPQLDPMLLLPMGRHSLSLKMFFLRARERFQNVVFVVDAVVAKKRKTRSIEFHPDTRLQSPTGKALFLLDVNKSGRAVREHGLLTEKFLKGVEGDAAGVNGDITANGLVKFLKRQVPNLLVESSQGDSLLLRLKNIPARQYSIRFYSEIIGEVRVMDAEVNEIWRGVPTDDYISLPLARGSYRVEQVASGLSQAVHADGEHFEIQFQPRRSILRRRALVIGVDSYHESELAVEPEIGIQDAVAIGGRLENLGYAVNLNIGVDTEFEIVKDNLEKFFAESAQGDLLWVHASLACISEGREVSDLILALKDTNLVRPRQTGITPTEIVQLFLKSAASGLILTIESERLYFTESPSVVDHVSPLEPSVDRDVLTMISHNFGGSWEDQGPLVHIALDLLPDNPSFSEEQAGLGEFRNSLKQRWYQWARNNDYETDNLVMESSGVLAAALVGQLEMDYQQVAADSADESPEWSLLEIGAAPLQASIDASEQIHRYSFVVPEPGAYRIEITGDTDTVMTLYGPDDENVFVAADDDSGDNRNARIVADLKSGNYFVQARHYLSDGRGNYAIQVLAQETSTDEEDTQESAVAYVNFSELLTAGVAQINLHKGGSPYFQSDHLRLDSSIIEDVKTGTLNLNEPSISEELRKRTLKAIGSKLGQILFEWDKPMTTGLQSLLYMIGGVDKLSLVFEVSDDSCHVPFECLVEPEGTFWALRAPIYRRLVRPFPSVRTTVRVNKPGTTNCLIINANARGPVDQVEGKGPLLVDSLPGIEEEVNSLTNFFEKNRLGQVRVVATLLEVEESLVTGNWDLVHFVGHTYHHDELDRNYLILPDEGFAKMLDTRHFADWLSQGGARFVYLSSSDDIDGKVTFEIARLAEVAVLGLLLGTPDRIALEHAMEIYSRFLVEGAPLEHALLETRRSLYEKFYQHPFWFSSVLYL